MSRVDYLACALVLAEGGLGHVAPNPLVGAVIVKDNKIIGEGWHVRVGDEHAEVAAINDATKKGFDTTGAKLYVTLEPCSHTGRQPPCTTAILKAGISEVNFSAFDTNPHVAGKGAKFLDSRGIKVIGGMLEAAARWQNRVYFNWVSGKRPQPYVCVKVAVSSDNKMTAKVGERTGITGAAANLFTQKLRQWCDAILVGAGTVIVDNPSLTVRAATLPAPARNPLRVVVDGLASIPLTADILKTKGTLVLVSALADKVKIKQLRRLADVTVVPASNGVMTPKHILAVLRKKGVTSVLVEGGANILQQWFDAKVVNEWILLKAPHKKFPGGLQFLKNPYELEKQFSLRSMTPLEPDVAFIYLRKK